MSWFKFKIVDCDYCPYCKTRVSADTHETKIICSRCKKQIFASFGRGGVRGWTSEPAWKFALISLLGGIILTALIVYFFVKP